MLESTFVKNVLDTKEKQREEAKLADRLVRDRTRIVYKYKVGYINAEYLYVNEYFVQGTDLIVNFEWGNAGDIDSITFPLDYLNWVEEKLIEHLKSLGPPKREQDEIQREFLKTTRKKFNEVLAYARELTPEDDEYTESLHDFFTLYNLLNK